MVEAYDGRCLRSARARALQEGLVFGASPDGTRAWLDFFAQGDEEEGTVPSATKRVPGIPANPSAGEDPNPNPSANPAAASHALAGLLPMAVAFEGEGSYDAPWRWGSAGEDPAGEGLPATILSLAVPEAALEKALRGLRAALRVCRRIPEKKGNVFSKKNSRQTGPGPGPGPGPGGNNDDDDVDDDGYARDALSSPPPSSSFVDLSGRVEGVEALERHLAESTNPALRPHGVAIRLAAFGVPDGDPFGGFALGALVVDADDDASLRSLDDAAEDARRRTPLSRGGLSLPARPDGSVGRGAGENVDARGSPAGSPPTPTPTATATATATATPTPGRARAIDPIASDDARSFTSLRGLASPTRETAPGRLAPGSGRKKRQRFARGGVSEAPFDPFDDPPVRDSDSAGEHLSGARAGERTPPTPGSSVIARAEARAAEMLARAPRGAAFARSGRTTATTTATTTAVGAGARSFFARVRGFFALRNVSPSPRRARVRVAALAAALAACDAVASFAYVARTLGDVSDVSDGGADVADDVSSSGKTFSFSSPEGVRVVLARLAAVAALAVPPLGVLAAPLAGALAVFASAPGVFGSASSPLLGRDAEEDAFAEATAAAAAAAAGAFSFSARGAFFSRRPSSRRPGACAAATRTYARWTRSSIAGVALGATLAALGDCVWIFFARAGASPSDGGSLATRRLAAAAAAAAKAASSRVAASRAADLEEAEEAERAAWEKGGEEEEDDEEDRDD